MSPLQRGLLVGLVQVALVLGVAAKLLVDRAVYPRVWMEAAGVDPDLPIRGRYVALNLLVADVQGAGAESATANHACGRLRVRDGAVVAVFDDAPAASRSLRGGGACFVARGGTTDVRWQLAEPVAFFLPEHARDPTLGVERGQLWIEVTLPPGGEPRPIRLAVRRDGRFSPLP